ncbi:UvrD-helicase domain-containing protein [Bacillus sp. 2205SS5-2]|uniref:UvrD-helicase domain-containing protein n=1 Tax=Bacillus sp. 2205SS5-2 TaxID=3109031 RepID=UPI0030058150
MNNTSSTPRADLQNPPSQNVSSILYHTQPIGSTKSLQTKATIASAQTSVELVSGEHSDAYFFRSLEQNGVFLNQPQIEAVRHGQGPALVLAGAGSGKTRVLISRAGYLMSVRQVKPKHILLLTFTKKAALEMKARMEQLPRISRSMISNVTTGTFHSIFLSILKWQGFTQNILSNEKYKHTAVKIILKEMKLGDSYEPETILSLLSHYKNKMISVDQVPCKTKIEKEIKEIFVKYESWKHRNQFIDFDDMLLESYFLLKKNPSILANLQQRFQYILCDEWQDTNPLQYELIKMIANPDKNVFVVGDDDQTIYSFNGADSSIILGFDQDFPATTKIYLDVNYRSSQNILSLANELIANNTMRHGKTLKATKTNSSQPVFLRPNTTDEEANLIIEHIKRAVTSKEQSYQDFAILHRTISSSRAIFEQMVLHDIPFVSYSRGDSFYEHSIVKPVLDYLRIALNGKNTEALKNILPTMYLQRDTAYRFIEEEELFYPKTQVIEHLLKMPKLKPFQKKQLSERISLIQSLTKLSAKQAIRKIRTFYDKYLETDDRKSLTLHKEVVKETLSELEVSAAQFDTVAQFISFIDDIIEKNREMEERGNKTDSDVVSLMTIHKSKGLEFPVVFLIGGSESILPHSSSLEADKRKDMISSQASRQEDNVVLHAVEEERRLAYVAITRAQEELYISSPAYYRGDKVAVSRFFIQPYSDAKSEIDTSIRRERKEVQTIKKQWTTLLVWDCESPSCNGWMRINSHEEEKDCPLCRQPMKQRKRKVQVRV